MSEQDLRRRQMRITFMNMREPDSLPLASINRAMALISLVGGLAFLCGGGWAIHHVHQDAFLLDHASTEGRVIRIRRMYVAGNITQGPARTIFRGGWFYRATVRYQAPGEGDILLEDPVGWVRPLFHVGQAVRVLFDPVHPHRAMIDRGWNNYVVPGSVGALALLMLWGGVRRLSGSSAPPRRKHGPRGPSPSSPDSSPSGPGLRGTPGVP